MTSLKTTKDIPKNYAALELSSRTCSVLNLLGLVMSTRSYRHISIRSCVQGNLFEIINIQRIFETLVLSYNVQADGLERTLTCTDTTRGTGRNNNVIITAKRRRDVVLTS